MIVGRNPPPHIAGARLARRAHRGQRALGAALSGPRLRHRHPAARGLRDADQDPRGVGGGSAGGRQPDRGGRPPLHRRASISSSRRSRASSRARWSGSGATASSRTSWRAKAGGRWSRSPRRRSPRRWRGTTASCWIATAPGRTATRTREPSPPPRSRGRARAPGSARGCAPSAALQRAQRVGQRSGVARRHQHPGAAGEKLGQLADRAGDDAAAEASASSATSGRPFGREGSAITSAAAKTLRGSSTYPRKRASSPRALAWSSSRSGPSPATSRVTAHSADRFEQDPVSLLRRQPPDHGDAVRVRRRRRAGCAPASRSASSMGSHGRKPVGDEGHRRGPYPAPQPALQRARDGGHARGCSSPSTRATIS